MPTSQRDEFILRLRQLAGANQRTKDFERSAGLSHATLAKKLGVKLSAIQRWLYRDRPSEWAVEALKGKLDKIWDEAHE